MKAKMKLKWLAATLGAATVAHAADLEWNPGAFKYWETATANWTSGGSSVTWDNANPDNAIFGATGAGPVSVTENIIAGDVAFNAPGYTINTLLGDLTATGFSGTEAVTKGGFRTLTLTNSTHSGGITLAAGTLVAAGDNALGTGTFTHSSGTLMSDSATARTFANDYVIGGNVTLGHATNKGEITFTGATSLGGAHRILTTPSDVELAGAISSGGITHAGSGTLTLSGGGTLNARKEQTKGPSVIQEAGGTLAFDDTWSVAYLHTTVGVGTATIDIKGSVSVTGETIIGQNTDNHTGIMNVNGTFTQSAGGLFIGNGKATAAGIVNVNSGGTFKLNSGITNFSIGRDDATGTINLNSGGVLETAIALRDSSNKDSGTANVNFDGGTLKALADLPDILQKNKTDSTYNVRIQDGGAIVDTNGFDVGISRDLSKDSGSAGGLTKNGTGTLTLTGTNNYDGATNITAGVLLVNGLHSGTGDVSVSSGATLGGTGSLAGDITVGGFLAAGDGANDIGALKTGSLNFAAGSTFAYEFQSDAAFNGDLIAAGGTLNIAFGAILDLSDLFAGALNVDDKLTLISYDGQWNGLFTYNGSELANGGTFTIGANDWLFRYDDDFGGTNFTDAQSGASKFVTMTVIPEPGAALLAALGGVFLIRRRRNNAVPPPRGEADAMPD